MRYPEVAVRDILGLLSRSLSRREQPLPYRDIAEG